MEKRIGLVQQGINSTSVSIKSLSGKATPFTEMTVSASLTQLRLLITYAVAHEEGWVNSTYATYQPALIIQHDRFARAQRQARASRDDSL